MYALKNKANSEVTTAMKVSKPIFADSTFSTPRPGVAIGDAGVRAVSSISGMPEVSDRPGVAEESMDNDHAVFKVEPGAGLKVGDQVLLIPAQQDAMVSRWDRFIGLRNGKVEVVWDIQARGCHN